MKDEIISGIKKRDKRSLAKLITLIESKRDDHNIKASIILSELKPAKKSLRLGVTGPPGVGKSSFINTFGTFLSIDKKSKVGVLAIDPSSPKTGGSILGDKTRMMDLSKIETSFIRPSPSSGNLGGITHKTYQVLEAMECFGFDYIFIESVGVGQSEIDISYCSDLFLFLLQPGSGDELQSIKRGIMEMANILLVTKSDGEQEVLANTSLSQIQSALALINPSAKTGLFSIYKKDLLENTIKLIENERPEIDKIREKQKLENFINIIKNQALTKINKNHDLIKETFYKNDQIGSGLSSKEILQEIFK